MATFFPRETVNKYQAIVFDLDDTLYLEHEYVVSGMRAVGAWGESAIGIDARRGFTELLALFEQGVRGTTFNLWLRSHNRESPDLVAAAIDVYRRHEPLITLFPEVAPLLGELRTRYKLGIVTDGYLDVQRGKLAALGLGMYVDATVVCDEAGRAAWKPNPHCFRLMLERLGGIPPDRAVYVGDNPMKDFLGARRAGMASVRVRRPSGEYALLEPMSPEHEPDLTIPSLAHLERDLGTLSGHPTSR
jgi:putative hydrolase of the HAD superfamily